LRVARSDDGTVRIALLDEYRLRVFVQGKGSRRQWAMEKSISLRQSISELPSVGEWHWRLSIPSRILSAVDGSGGGWLKYWAFSYEPIIDFRNS
jgi:hypothetical protein